MFQEELGLTGILDMKSPVILNDAIFMSGGLRATREKINFTRIDKNGNLDSEIFLKICKTRKLIKILFYSLEI